jgi:sulfur carrier protein ThiS
MQIKIKFYGSHAHRAGIQSGTEIVTKMTNGSSIGEFLRELGIGDTRAILSVNGTTRKSDYVLSDGDAVAIYDVLEGG